MIWVCGFYIKNLGFLDGGYRNFSNGALNFRPLVVWRMQEFSYGGTKCEMISDGGSVNQLKILV